MRCLLFPKLECISRYVSIKLARGKEPLINLLLKYLMFVIGVLLLSSLMHPITGHNIYSSPLSACEIQGGVHGLVE